MDMVIVFSHMDDYLWLSVDEWGAMGLLGLPIFYFECQMTWPSSIDMVSLCQDMGNVNEYSSTEASIVAVPFVALEPW